MVGLAHIAPAQFHQHAVFGLGLEGLLRELDHLTVVGAHKTRRAKQVGLAQAALGHLGRVVFKAEVRPHKVKRTMPVGLDVPRGHAVDLLLKNHAREQRHHHRRGHLLAHLPPALGHDVQKTGVVQLHAFLKAAHLRDLRRSARGLARATAGRDHGGVAVVRVHAQLALVVGTPEAKGHKPGVQQARVIRVLDVFLHQLPVARDALAVVAQHHQLAAVEQAVKVFQDGRAHEVFERLHGRVKRREHHAAARGHFQGREAMVLGVKVGGHAAVDLAVLAHAAPERHALQVALEAVAPLVVGADKLFLVAMALAAKLHAPVGADVLDHMDLAVSGARHDDRALTHHRALEIAGVRDLGLQAHIAPVAFVKKALQLLLVPVFVGVHGKRNAAGAFRFPVDGMFGHVSVSSNACCGSEPLLANERLGIACFRPQGRPPTGLDAHHVAAFEFRKSKLKDNHYSNFK